MFNKHCYCLMVFKVLVDIRGSSQTVFQRKNIGKTAILTKKNEIIHTL